MTFRSQLDILHLTSAHPLRDTRIFVKEARSLAAAGFRVAVAGPGQADAQSETIDGIGVIPLRRPRGRMGRFTVLGWRLYKVARMSKARAIHIHDPDLLLIGLLLSWQKGRVIYDVHENYSKSMLSRAWLRLNGMRKLAAFGVRWVEGLAAKRFAGFVVADHSLTPPYPDDRCIVVRNYLLPDEWPDPVRLTGARDGFRCIYVGDVSQARGFSVMCGAVALLRGRGVAISLDLVGNIPPALKEALNTHPAKCHITTHGQCSRKDVATKLANSDAAFCMLASTPAYRDALPVKVLEYLMMGLPVIASDLPRLRSEKPLAPGLHFCAPQDVVAVADALELILNDRKTAQVGALAARDAVLENYQWASEEIKLVEFYRNLLG